jgi:FkbM family methyltransferase
VRRPINYQKLRAWEQTIYAVTESIANEALNYLPAGGVLVDIGANVGLFTAQVLAKRPCTALLFEPVPEYFEYCRERFGGLSDVAVENVALSDTAGKMRLWLDSQNLGWNTMVGEKVEGEMTETVVDAITFDDYAERVGIDRIDVIKLDVEGGEYKVLAGMHRTLARLQKKPVILCEIGWGTAHPQWKEELEQFEWLFAHGYERIDLTMSKTTDVVFLPKRGKSSSATRLTIDDFVIRADGRYRYLDNRLIPESLTDWNLDLLAELFLSLPPFYLHFGGVGDALLLLSSFYDTTPKSNVVSLASSINALRSFYDCFPALDAIYFLEHPREVVGGQLIRALLPSLRNCIGRGVCSQHDHIDEWKSGIDIFRSYGVGARPAWAQAFKPHRLFEVQIAIAPCGSRLAMTDGKNNSVSPSYWHGIISLLRSHGVTPLVLGTPAEELLYPALEGCVSKRSYDFRSQMELIAGSELLIGADSWPKTFAALRGVPALVFPPLIDGKHVVDVSANVFLRPWPTITLVHSLEELTTMIEQLFAGAN